MSHIQNLIPSYHPGELNRCPYCTGTHWHVGRLLAECARCHAALPIAARPAIVLEAA